MLVLTRKSNEQIRIGDNITISILRVKGKSVQVGIDAPRGIRVVRGELPVFDDAEASDFSGDAETSTTEALSTTADEEGPIAEHVVTAMQAFVDKRCRGGRRRARQCRGMKAMVVSTTVET